ncbi:MAG: hypothetical protein IJN37_08150 [Clostridia bacterium]|nr:hypothetical protein [Clostridia bacterium]
MGDILFVVIVLGLLFFCAIDNIKKGKKIRGGIQLIIVVLLAAVFLILFGMAINKGSPPEITTAFPPT